MEDDSRIFKRITWEQIYEYISNSNFSGHDKQNMTKYFKNKSIGYDSNGRGDHLDQPVGPAHGPGPPERGRMLLSDQINDWLRPRRRY